MERDVWLCAVSLEFLTSFASKIPENFSTSDVVEKVIKPATAEAKCRYVDLVPACHVGHSTYFISHRWGCNFRAELVAVLLQRFGAEAAVAAGTCSGAAAAAGGAAAAVSPTESGLLDPQTPAAAAAAAAAASAPGQAPVPSAAGQPAKAPGGTAEAAAGEPEPPAAAVTGGSSPQSTSSVFLWLDIFAVNQWPNTTQADDLANLQAGPGPRVFENVIRHSRATVMLLDPQGAVLTRIWCLYEAWKTAEYKGPGGLQMLAPLSAVHYGALEAVFVRLDVMAAEATVEADRVRILAEVAASMGAAALNVYIKGALVDSAVIESNAALPAASAIAAPILQAISALQQQERQAQAAVEAERQAGVEAERQAEVEAERQVEAGVEAGPERHVAPQVAGGSATTAAAAAPVSSALAPPPAPPHPQQQLQPQQQQQPPKPMFTLSQEETTTLLRGAAACFRAARMLQFVANLRTAEMLIREALALFTAAEGGAGGTHSLACLQALANILMPMKGRLDEARAVLQATLAASAKVHGPRHEATAAVVNDLGLIAFWREDWADAEAHFKSALAIYEERLGAMPAADHSEAVLAGRMSLGVVVAKQGPQRADEAEAILMSVLEGYSRRAGGKADQGVAEARGHLGKLAEARGRHGQAEEHFAQAAALSRQIFGAQHPAVADALAGIARQLAATGRLSAAVELSHAAYATALAALGPGGSGLVDRLAAQLADQQTRLAAEGAAAGEAAAAAGAAGDAGPRQAEGQAQQDQATAAVPAPVRQEQGQLRETQRPGAAAVTAGSSGEPVRAGAGGAEASRSTDAPAEPWSSGGTGAVQRGGDGLPAAAAEAPAPAAAQSGASAAVASGPGTQGDAGGGLPGSSLAGGRSGFNGVCAPVCDGGSRAGGGGGAPDDKAFGHVAGDGGSRGVAGGGEAAGGDGEGRPRSRTGGTPAVKGPEQRPPSGMAVSPVVRVRPQSSGTAAGGSSVGVGKGRAGRRDDGRTAQGEADVGAVAAVEKAMQVSRQGASSGATAASTATGGDDAVSGGCGAAACLPPRWRRSSSGVGAASNRVAPAP
ncbi:hypothetical protein HYH02_013028 [Chlamydomonas schloesseri]|uniref:Uncharacterized protein n=1 Tax=Chlamydomonas schloesseri TaxID=2026947 RepID=A0A835T659_9CHLO|nr:hypothetical protein HYH02_013028 [Chlamydomonas schloesseri]|eukprot:KAG2432306.1 hypothetical protein HYH02_013028 [Chlamydomonas schloesseri]